MLNLHWALERDLLADTLDASLVAYARDRDLGGQLHLDTCWTLADQTTEVGQSDNPHAAGRVMLDLSWAHVQGLVDAEARADRPGTGAACSCISDPSAQLPAEIALAHHLGVLHTLLSDDSAADPAHPTTVLLAAADALGERRPGVRNERLLAALDDLLTQAAPVVAQVDANRRPVPQQHAAKVRYLTAAARTFRDLEFLPATARDVAAVEAADAETVAGWWDAVVASGVWREAVNPSTISVRAVTGAWVDPATRRLLVRLPESAARGTLLSRQPVLSTNPDVDPATL